MFPSLAITTELNLFLEAAEARLLASQIEDAASVRDLLQYAAALELAARSQQSHTFDFRCDAEPWRGSLEAFR
jgi:hypothetical protein